MSEGRILVVADRDFGRLIFHQQLFHAGVIFFRLPGANLGTKVDLLYAVLVEHAGDLERGKFPVVTALNVRVADRPPA